MTNRQTMINGKSTLSFQFIESELDHCNMTVMTGCKKLRFRGDSDGISCVRNVMEVSDKVAAVNDRAQTFTSVQS